jgi:hypothetical protein
MFAFGSRESNATTEMETQQKRLYQNGGERERERERSKGSAMEHVQN